MELKDKLQLLRKQNGYSQEQLADKLGIARQTLSKWENGQAVPELGNLISLAEEIEAYCEEHSIIHTNFFYHEKLVAQKKGNE